MRVPNQRNWRVPHSTARTQACCRPQRASAKRLQASWLLSLLSVLTNAETPRVTVRRDAFLGNAALQNDDAKKPVDSFVDPEESNKKDWGKGGARRAHQHAAVAGQKTSPLAPTTSAKIHRIFFFFKTINSVSRSLFKRKARDCASHWERKGKGG